MNLRKTVLTVATLNLIYFCVEFYFGRLYDSVALIGDSIDFLEDPTKTGFLFSVSIGKKYDIKENSIAICHSIGCGPVFGLNDLEIVENADRNYNYFSNIGTSYNFDDIMEDFYGAAKYLVEDYEAYEVLFV